MTLKTKIIIAGVALFLIVFFASTSWYLYKVYQEEKLKAERATLINYNNMKASLDSLRTVISTQGNKEYEKMAFLYDMQARTDLYLREELKKQGFKLSSLQEVSMKLEDLKVMLQGGTTNVDSNYATYSFPPLDTLMLNIAGRTVIDLKDNKKSFTSLDMKFRPIEALIKIARNKKTGEVVGSVEPLMKGLTITSMRTEVDPDIYAPIGEEHEELFMDNLRLGFMAGVSPWKDYEMSYGVSLQYKNMGFWALTHTGFNFIGMSYSIPVGRLFK